MPDWQLTATTILCDTCGAEVTIIVYKDRTVKCTGTSIPSGKDKRAEAPACSAEKCARVNEYKAKLDAEEQGG